MIQKRKTRRGDGGRWGSDTAGGANVSFLLQFNHNFSDSDCQIGKLPIEAICLSELSPADTNDHSIVAPGVGYAHT